MLDVDVRRDLPRMSPVGDETGDADDESPRREDRVGTEARRAA